MKNKPNFWYKQSAVIPYRVINNNIEILIITTRKGTNWTIPKGIVNPDLSPKESAVKELFEEAGATGKLIDKKFGTYSYKKWGGKCKVKVFGLLVENIMERWEENFRERKWINENEVELFIGNKKLLKIIKDFFQSEDHKK